MTHPPRLLLCMFFCIFIAVISHAQVDVTESFTEKQRELFTEAKKFTQAGDYTKANKKYEELLRLSPDFTEGKLRLAGNYYALKQLGKAEELYKDAVLSDPDFNNDVYFTMGLVQADLKKYTEAVENLDIYILRDTTNSPKIGRAKMLRNNLLFRNNAMKHPVPFVPVSLGPTINSDNSDYSPCISLDGSTMIFTRNVKRAQDFIGQEDFYMSTYDSTGWKVAQPVSDLNTYQNEGAFAISATGNYIVFTACDRKDAYGSCDLYYAMKINDRWTAPVNMGHKVNSAAWDSQPTLSADGRMLIFSSRRLGSTGGADLWFTYRNDKNAWVTPVNLGPAINTTGDDESPFLHPDGTTLYFRSNGRPGMGGFDIYYSRKNDSLEIWNEPINIGYPINTEGNEGAFTVSLDGKKAYFASDIDYLGGKKLNNLDIFSFDLYEEARPKPTTFIKGFVKDALSEKPVSALITIKDLVTGMIKFQTLTDSTGYFVAGITSGRNYACIAENKDYQYVAKNFDLSASNTQLKPYMLTIALYPIKNDKNINEQPVILQNIFFQSGSAELLPASNVELDLLLLMLQKHTGLHISIIGHTDDVGDEAANQLLSEKRAAAVANALITKGIAANRISSTGKGESQPIAPNDTEAGRKINRRTEFILTQK